MSALVERAIEVLKSLPEEKQVALAGVILDAENVYHPTAAEQKAIDEGLADVSAGRVVDEETVRDRWRRRALS